MVTTDFSCARHAVSRDHPLQRGDFTDDLDTRWTIVLALQQQIFTSHLLASSGYSFPDLTVLSALAFFTMLVANPQILKGFRKHRGPHYCCKASCPLSSCISSASIGFAFGLARHYLCSASRIRRIRS